MEFISLYLFLAVCLLLMLGFPVAFTLAGTALAFATVGTLTGVFDTRFLAALPGRIFGTMNNTTLIAVPLFILMGTILERSRVAEELLHSMSRLFRGVRGGLGIAIISTSKGLMTDRAARAAGIGGEVLCTVF